MRRIPPETSPNYPRRKDDSISSNVVKQESPPQVQRYSQFNPEQRNPITSSSLDTLRDQWIFSLQLCTPHLHSVIIIDLTRLLVGATITLPIAITHHLTVSIMIIISMTMNIEILPVNMKIKETTMIIVIISL